MATAPIPPGTGPIQVPNPRPAAPKLPGASAPTTGPLVPGDRNLAGPVGGAMKAGAVNLDAVNVPEMLDNSSDALYGVMEADRMRLRDGNVGKIGMVAAIANIALDARTLVKALNESPIKLDRVIGPLVGIAVNLGEFVEKGALAGIAGASNAIQGFMGAVDAVKRMKEEGANPSNIMEALSYATQSLGGVAATLALVAPVLAPALVPLSTGLYLASGALLLGQLAYDNREWIKDKATKLWGTIETGATSLVSRLTGPPRAAPREPSR